MSFISTFFIYRNILVKKNYFSWLTESFGIDIVPLPDFVQFSQKRVLVSGGPGLKVHFLVTSIIVVGEENVTKLSQWSQWHWQSILRLCSWTWEANEYSTGGLTGGIDKVEVHCKWRACGNINVWFRFMYSQKWNRASHYFQNRIIMFCLPISTFMYMWAISTVYSQDRFAYFAEAK
jgi:hypothetical protein